MLCFLPLNLLSSLAEEIELQSAAEAELEPLEWVELPQVEELALLTQADRSFELLRLGVEVEVEAEVDTEVDWWIRSEYFEELQLPQEHCLCFYIALLFI